MNKPTLRLRFIGESATLAELNRIELTHPLIGGTRILARGKFHGSLQDTYSLPWTRATKALSVLLLRALIDAKNPKTNRNIRSFYGLSSAECEAIRSIDYALSKKPIWLQDLFSTDQLGNCNSARFFHRGNPEGKRPGPITMKWNSNMVPLNDIAIFLNDKRLNSLAQLKGVLSDLLRSLNEIALSDNTKISDSILPLPAHLQSSPLSPTLNAKFQQLIHGEVAHSLRATNVFTNNDLMDALSSINNLSLYRKIVGQEKSYLNSILEHSCASVRTGVSGLKNHCDYDKWSEPIHVAVCTITVSSIVLFHYLKEFRKIPIVIDYSFASAIDLAHQVVKKTIAPELCIGATPSAAQIISKARNDYAPVMLLPRHSHRVLSHKSAQRATFRGEYKILMDEPSGALFYYSTLMNRGIIKNSEVSASHCDADDILRLLEQGDKEFRTIAWFPIYNLGELLCGARAIDADTKTLGENWIFLMAHERLRKDQQKSRYILGALHSAWIDLKNNDELLKSVIRSLMNDETYQLSLSRTAGLHKLANQEHGCNDSTMSQLAS